MSQRPGSFVNAAGILASDTPADVVRKLDAAREAASIPASMDLVDMILNCQPLVHINSSTRLWELLHAAGLSVSDQPEFFRALLASRTDA